MSDDTINNGVEYALYWLAVHEPEVLDEAEKFSGGMLTNDRYACRRVKALMAGTKVAA